MQKERLKSRPVEPKTLTDRIDLSYINAEELLISEVLMEKDGVVEARHLILGTNEQLSLLQQCSTIYVDGTFKCTRPPFQQLFGIHTFLRSGQNIKQVPLINVLMTRREKNNAVFFRN